MTAKLQFPDNPPCNYILDMSPLSWGLKMVNLCIWASYNLSKCSFTIIIAGYCTIHILSLHICVASDIKNIVNLTLGTDAQS